MKNSKAFWWFLLASCAGMTLIGCAAGIIALLDSGLGAVSPIVLIWIFGEVLLGIAAVRNLKRLYAETPAQWTGRWQLRLSDLLAIVFFAGATMAAVRELSPESFARVGAASSLLIVLAYAASMLFVSRTDVTITGVEKWVAAFALMIGIIFTIMAGVVVQLFLLAGVALLICH
ncbi:MAG TPA: hypothetical protein VKX17_28560 [Planctomycetota bacterium]|nr:hypothetical protein [Planctomycetota bacterium]